MNSLNILLDKYKAARSLPSDKALAESLGLSRQSVHRWRNDGGIDDEYVARMAEAIGDASEDWLLRIHMETSSEAAKRGWLRLASRLAAAAAAVALTIGVTRPAEAHALAVGYSNQPADIYIMRSNGQVGTTGKQLHRFSGVSAPATRSHLVPAA